MTIDTNIVQFSDGSFRVYGYDADPVTGKAKKIGKRFPKGTTLPVLQAYRDTRNAAATVDEPEAGSAEETFRAAATRYLGLRQVRKMPAFKTREIEINHWIDVFGDQPRASITAPMINKQLHTWHEAKYAGGTCNKQRTALMSMWTVLDGRSAANPVKDVDEFDEAPMGARGQSLDVITRILDSIADVRGLEVDRVTLYDEVWAESAIVVAGRYGISSTMLKKIAIRLDVPTPPRGYWAKAAGNRPERPALRRSAVAGQSPDLLLSRARLEVLLWTGMDPGTLKRMTLADVDFVKGQYTPPVRRKGEGVRDLVPLPMWNDDARAAWQRLVDVGGLTDTPRWFSTQSLYKCWQRACRRVEGELRAEYGDPRFRIPKIRLKDIRHSIGTHWFEKTGDLNAVGEMLQHAPGSKMTRRYALGAVSSVLRRKMARAAAGTSTTRRNLTRPRAGVLADSTGVVPFPRKP